MLPNKNFKIQGVSGMGCLLERCRYLRTKSAAARQERAHAFTKATPSAPKAMTNAGAFYVCAHNGLAGGGRHCPGALPASTE